MARQLMGKKRMAAAKGRAVSSQKQGTEESKTINSRNVEMNRLAREQEAAAEKGMFEGNWMKALGTIVAIGAVMAVTGGFGLPALIGAAGSGATFAGTGALALGSGLASGLGTLAGMGIGDAIGGDVEGAMQAAGEIDQDALYRGTVGGNYGTMFDPLASMSERGSTMASGYESQKRQGYVFAPLTSAVTAGGGSYTSSLKYAGGPSGGAAS